MRYPSCVVSVWKSHSCYPPFLPLKFYSTIYQGTCFKTQHCTNVISKQPYSDVQVPESITLMDCGDQFQQLTREKCFSQNS